MSNTPHFSKQRMSQGPKDYLSLQDIQWLEQLDSICEAFESDWKKGLNPIPEVYAAQVEPSRFVETHRELVLVQQECIRGLYLPPLEAMELPSGNDTDRSGESGGQLGTEGNPLSGHEDVWRIDEPDRIPSVPKSIGRYLLMEEIGSGTDGIVFRAEDTEIKRTVALKIPKTYFHRRSIDPQAFLREARSAIHHPNIVRVYDRGVSQGIPYLITEYVHGVDMKTYLKRSAKFDYHQIATWVAELAEALDYAHSLGVFHRDVKPSNIMLETNLVAPHLRKEGEPIAKSRAKLLDFGIAKLHDAGTMGTHCGDVIGTPHYMSPEQARGQSHLVDGRSDIYSLGVVFYEALCGKTPFVGQSWELLTQIYSCDVPLVTERNPEIPHPLARICHRCLQRNPEERYASAGLLALDLRSYLDNRDIGSTSDRTASGSILRSIPWPWAIGGATLATIIFAPFLAGMVSSKEGANRDTIALRPLAGFDRSANDTNALSRFAAELRWADPTTLYEYLTDSTEDRAAFTRDFQALMLEGSLADPESRLRVVSSLLMLDPTSWDQLSLRSEAISLLLREAQRTDAASNLIPWLRYYAGVKEPLVRSLESLLHEQQEEKTRVAVISLLSILYAESPERFLGQLREAPSSEVQSWLDNYRIVRHDLSSLLASAREPDDREFSLQQEGESLARQQANVLLAQWANGDFDSVWRMLKNRRDPRVRTYFLNSLSPSNVPVVQLVDRLEIEEDPEILYGIIVGLGLQTAAQRTYWEAHVLTWITQAYESHPDGGVHSACQWLLRTWGRGDLVDQIDARLILEGESPNRNWYVNSLGMHMLRVDSPHRYWVGTPRGVARSVVDEMGHEVELKHSFYVSAGEVTWSQWNALMPPSIPEATLEEYRQRAATFVDFTRCIEFCNLLNLKEDRFDFPNRLEDSGAAYRLDDNQTGYRLLRDQEWERCARANTITDCHFGMQVTVQEGLPYCNSHESIGDSCISIPNSLGLFDCFGNAAEWVADKWMFQDSRNRDTSLFEFSKSSIVRGRFITGKKETSLYRKYPLAVAAKDGFIGFRIGRTFRDKENE